MTTDYTTTEIESILYDNPLGEALLPILKNFEGVDSLLYSDIAKALFRAYEAGVRGCLTDFSSLSRRDLQ